MQHLIFQIWFWADLVPLILKLVFFFQSTCLEAHSLHIFLRWTQLVEVVGLFATLYTYLRCFLPNYLQLLPFFFFLQLNTHLFDWVSLVVQHLHDYLRFTHKVRKRLMVYICINDMICNVSTENIEEHDYVLLIRFLESGYALGASESDDIFGLCHSVHMFSPALFCISNFCMNL